MSHIPHPGLVLLVLTVTFGKHISSDDIILRALIEVPISNSCFLLPHSVGSFSVNTLKLTACTYFQGCGRAKLGLCRWWLPLTCCRDQSLGGGGMAPFAAPSEPFCLRHSCSRVTGRCCLLHSWWCLCRKLWELLDQSDLHKCCTASTAVPA